MTAKRIHSKSKLKAPHRTLPNYVRVLKEDDARWGYFLFFTSAMRSVTGSTMVHSSPSFLGVRDAGLAMTNHRRR